MHGGVPVGADRDPSHLVFSPAVPVGYGSFGWGPASVLIHTGATQPDRDPPLWARQNPGPVGDSSLPLPLHTNNFLAQHFQTKPLLLGRRQLISRRGKRLCRSAKISWIARIQVRVG